MIGGLGGLCPLRRPIALVPPPFRPFQPLLTELLDDRLEVVKVGLVLSLVLDLGLDTLKDADGGSVVVDLARGTEGSLNDGGGGDEVVGEAVVQSTLELEEVANLLEEGGVLGVELVVGLLPGVRGREANGCVMLVSAICVSRATSCAHRYPLSCTVRAVVSISSTVLRCSAPSLTKVWDSIGGN